jgi:murein tripeptide amidase MpaA
MRYDGHRVVRAEILSIRDMRVMLALSPDPWSHGMRMGTMDFRVPPEALAALERSGVRYSVLIDNVQALIDGERARLAEGDGGAAGEIVQGWFDNYRDYAAVNDYLDELAALEPGIAEVFEVGQSLEGRAIRGIRISGPDVNDPSLAKPAVLFNGCQHAREWVAVMVPMYIADTLVRQYDLDPAIADIVDRVEFLIVPIVNPDGYQFSWDDQRLWRKNRRDNGDGTFGVDLNRNWGFEWGGQGSSGNTASETYRGPAPFSEPESAALRDFFIANPQIAAHIDFHSYSQLVLQPWGYTESLPDAFDILNLFGVGMADLITNVHDMPYVSGPAYTILYPASGVVIDWTYGDQGIFAFTTELRDTGEFGFILPADQIIPTAEENLPAALQLADWITQAILFTFPQQLPTVVQADRATPVSVEIAALAPASLSPETATLITRIGAGDFTEQSLTPVGGGSLFTGALPGASCGEVIEYYFEAQTTRGTTYRSPASAPAELFEAVAVQTNTVFEDEFEADLGWVVGAPSDTATAGVWTRVNPVGSIAQPENDASPDGAMCYVTGQGALGAQDGSHDVDGGGTSLTSPPLVVEHPESALSYALWYSNNLGANPGTDTLLVQLSPDGGKSWSVLEEVQASTNSWVERSFNLAAVAPGAEQIVIRFVASDYGGGSLIEAAVDDVRIQVVQCDDGPPADLDGDGVVNGSDLGLLLLAWGDCLEGVAECPADLDRDGTVTGADLGLLLLAWTG